MSAQKYDNIPRSFGRTDVEGSTIRELFASDLNQLNRLESPDNVQRTVTGARINHDHVEVSKFLRID